MIFVQNVNENPHSCPISIGWRLTGHHSQVILWICGRHLELMIHIAENGKKRNSSVPQVQAFLGLKVCSCSCPLLSSGLIVVMDKMAPTFQSRLMPCHFDMLSARNHFIFPCLSFLSIFLGYRCISPQILSCPLLSRKRLSLSFGTCYLMSQITISNAVYPLIPTT